MQGNDEGKIEILLFLFKRELTFRFTSCIGIPFKCIGAGTLIGSGSISTESMGSTGLLGGRALVNV